MDSRRLTPPQVPRANGAAEKGGCAAVSHVATADELLAWALWWARQGLGVFPCEAGGKRPETVHGFKDATTAEQRIRAWWRGRAYNIGCATGYPGPDVLDVDVRPDGNGWAAFNALKRAGLLAGAQRLVRTRAGGLHVHFSGTGQRCGSLAKTHHLDFKSRGGLVLLPPSYVDEDGIAGSYELIDSRPPTGATFDWEAVKRLLCPPRPALVRPLNGRPGRVGHLPAWVAEQEPGNRNAALFWAACRAAEAGDQDVLRRLVGAAVHAGLDEAEARRTVISAARKVSDGR